MITIRNYAKSKGVSYEAIRQQIQRYQSQLDDHISIVKKVKYLDAWAVEFLDKKREGKPIVVVSDTGTNQEINDLKNEKEQLLIKVAMLQEELLKEKDNVKLLQTEKIQLLESEKKEWKSFLGKWEIRRKK